MGAGLDEAYYNYTVDAPASISTNFYLMLNDNSYGYTSSASDIDAYQIHVDSGNTYTFVASKNSNGYATFINLYDRNGNLLATSTNYGNYTGITFTSHDNLYFLGTTSSGDGYYTISGGNNTITDPNVLYKPIYGGVIYSDGLYYTSDAHNYVFNAVAGHTYEAIFDTQIPDLFLKISYLSANGYQPVTTTHASNSFIFTPNVSGTFNLSVSSNSYVNTVFYSFIAGDITPGLSPTYNVISSGSTVEGQKEIFIISTTNVTPGTVIGYSITGTNNAASLSGMGSVAVDNYGQASVVLTIPTNLVNGDNGSLTLSLTNGLASSLTVSVADASGSSASTFVSTIAQTVLREDAVSGPHSALLASVVSQLAAGTSSPAAATASVIALAASTTAVATLSYDFFTGSTPSAGG